MFRFLSRSILYRALLLAALAAFLRGGSLNAQWCEAVNEFGVPRECTLTEKFGHCLDNVLVSYNQCLGHDVWDVVCDAGAAFDLVACAAGLPWWALVRK